jgi:hypothetical protein
MHLLFLVASFIALASAVPAVPMFPFPYRRPLEVHPLHAPVKKVENQHEKAILNSPGCTTTLSNSTEPSLAARKAPPKTDPPRGCGIAIDNVRKKETLIGDGECHYLLMDIDHMHVGDGCDCVTFESSLCGASEPKYWSSWIRGPSTDGKLPTWGSHWYACSDDRAFGKVFVAALVGNVEFVLTNA